MTRYEPDARGVYEAFEQVVAERHADTLFSTDGATVDEQVAALLRGSRIPPTADDRRGGVVHRRPAGGPADRARRARRST